MDRHVYKGNDFILTDVNIQPVCAEDFCDSCGDCLHCYGDDTCYSNEDGKHFWVYYQED